MRRHPKHRCLGVEEGRAERPPVKDSCRGRSWSSYIGQEDGGIAPRQLWDPVQMVVYWQSPMSSLLWSACRGTDSRDICCLAAAANVGARNMLINWACRQGENRRGTRVSFGFVWPMHTPGVSSKDPGNLIYSLDTIPYQKQTSKALTCCKAPRSGQWYQTLRIPPSRSWWVIKLPIPSRRFHPHPVAGQESDPQCIHRPERRPAATSVFNPQAPSLAHA